MSTIDVLWLEDHPEEYFKKLAKNKKYNINLVWFGRADEALIYIDKYINQLDGAILDARGHCVQGDGESEKGMYEVIRKLTSYSRERPIPVAVITGQKDLLQKEGFEDSVLYKLFWKNRDEMDVLKYIREGAEKLDDVKTKIEHPLVFEIFDKEIVKKIVEDSKIQTLKWSLIMQLRNPIDIILTPRVIRGFFEGLIFPLMQNYGVIPAYCKDFNDKARELSIKKKGFSEDIERLFKAIAFCSQELNHEKPGAKVVEYIQKREDPYYVDCLFKGLLSILTWLSVFIDSQNKFHDNK